ncbi:MAG: geranylgeranyl reductase family protein [Candidatus Odinarchaeota archaeon]
MSSDDYDVIIVGAGTGGSATGIELAKRGLKVLIIESRKKEKIGDKICGDATSQSYYTRIAKEYGSTIKPPHGDEIRLVINEYAVISPDREHQYSIKRSIKEDDASWIIDRYAFGQRLINEAVATGCQLIDNTRVVKPVIENDFVVGVIARDKKAQEIREYRAKVVVDASGIGAVIRKNLDQAKTHMDTELLKTDIEYAYREIRRVKNPIKDHTKCRIYFDQSLAPGGYYWVFPGGSNIVNAGLGVEPTGEYPSAKELFKQQVLKGDVRYSGADFEDSEVLNAGGAFVPLRRAIDTLVWNGLVLVGDAGCTVKPTDGGGIGISILAGVMAADPITEAIKSGDYSRDGPLWKFNLEYMRKQAIKTSPLTIVKRVIIKVDNETINEIFRLKLVTQEEIDSVNRGEGLSLSIFGTAKKLVKARKILGLLNELRKAKKDYDKAKELYLSFPESYSNFTTWKEKIEGIFSKYYD